MKKAFATLSALLFATSIAFAQEDASDNFSEQEAAADDFAADEAIPQFAESEEAPAQEAPAEEAPAKSEQEPAKTEEEVPQYAGEPVPQYAGESEFGESEVQALPAKKESRLSVGIKAAYNYGFIFGMDDEQDDMDELPSGSGFEAGVMLKLKLVDNLSFAPEVNLSFIDLSHSYQDKERAYSRTDLEIPILLRGYFMDRFYVSFGPQITLNISNSVDIEDNDNGEFSEDFDQSTFEFGVAAGFGIKIVDKLFFDFRIYMGLTEIFPDVDYFFDEDFDIFNSKNWSEIDFTDAKLAKVKVGLSYWFL